MRNTFKVKGSILLTCLLLVTMLFAASYEQGQDPPYGNKTVVYKQELIDLLSVIDLSKNEAEYIVNNLASDVLTWNDIYSIFDYIKYTSIISDRRKEQVYEAIPRDRFIDICKLFFTATNVSVEEISFVYLGHTPDDRIISNDGNYESSLPKDFFTYGESYHGMAVGNKILCIDSVSIGLSNSVVSINQSDTNDLKSNNVIIDIPKTIKVLLTNDNKQNPIRDSFEIKVTSSCSITCGTQKKTFEKNKIFSQNSFDELFEVKDVIMIIPDTPNTIYIKEADSKQWSSSYRGVLYVFKKNNQFYLVNQLPVEEYLYGVVPGEMPQRFHLEALKAQAVCARTYAYTMINSNAYKKYHADVDDSVNCQVYNKNGENHKAKQAVDETNGIVLLALDNNETSFKNIDLADIYYFSTSCGYTTGLEAWGSEKSPYLTSVSTLYEPEVIDSWEQFLKKKDVEAFDGGSNFFRWTAELSIPGANYLSINKREESGVVTEISYTLNGKKRVIKTEYDIRKDLGSYITKLEDSNGNAINMSILPSAWFVVEKTNEANKYALYGGGYGHGIGMCQYGANGMANAGMTYMEILKYYFKGIIIKNLY